ncbi:unnamed protein product [Cylicocyclus nassatus]|uniref:Uncharacterized protein n=1 Tax=Cylicocyclus nassatus TaxID=53992 RepID=A0AA36DTN6_CYLNA|nr:unnamed protein product [Cylicocyclus nassatus]
MSLFKPLENEEDIRGSRVMLGRHKRTRRHSSLRRRLRSRTYITRKEQSYDLLQNSTYSYLVVSDFFLILTSQLICAPNFSSACLNPLTFSI